MGKIIDLIDQRFGRLIIVKQIPRGDRINGGTIWLCRCDCGNYTESRSDQLKSGRTQSCGCLAKDRSSKTHLKHGHTANKLISRTYRTWGSMLSRCNNPNNCEYKNYGGRGITVCERWSKFENFLKDMGERPIGKSIDRKNGENNYNLKNCRWATPAEQSRNNRRTKLNPLKVQIIKKLLKESKLLHREISELFGVATNTITTINTRGIWKDINESH